MKQTTEEKNIDYISNDAVILKKMRLLKRLNRQQAGLLFDFSFKYIEKLENGKEALEQIEKNGPLNCIISDI